MLMPRHTPVRPPPAPAFARRLRFDLPELMGLPVLAMLPLLALFGVFDEQRASSKAEHGGLVLEVDYPGRLRFEQDAVLDLVVRNDRDQPQRGLRLAIDRRYLARFDNLRFEPPSGTLHSDHWELLLPPLAAREVRHVRIEVRAAAAGVHGGHFALAATDGTRLGATIQTLIWP